MKSVLDRSFRYTPSVDTDVKKTFARIRRQQREAELAKMQRDGVSTSRVLSLDVKKSAHSGSQTSFPKSI